MTRVLVTLTFLLALSGAALAQPATVPFTDRGQPNAAELEATAAARGETLPGRITIPDRQAAVLIQPEGRDWRIFHNRTLTWIGGIAVLGMLGALTLFYLIRGRIRVDSGLSGRSIRRFGALERANHWMVATSFLILGLSGLNLTFGRYLLLPMFGPEAFTLISQWGKYAHNYLSLPFTIGILLMLVLWIADNLPSRGDLAWLRAGGGFLGGEHPPADRFNAGQKLVFWITVLGGGLVAASGYMLIFPFVVTGVEGMQWSHIVHGTLSVLMVAAIMAHIYIGSLGMEGGFSAMGSGQVDYNWAREHHSLWVEKEIARARSVVDRPRGARAAGAD